MPELAIKNPGILSPCKAEKNYNYCVIYTAANSLMDMTKLLKNSIPAKHGTVFCPMMEVWRRGKEKGCKTVPLFPGYLFIRSDLSVHEIHSLVRKRRYELITFARELGLKSHCSDDQDQGDEIRVNDLTEEEAAFMDFVMEIDSVQNPDNYVEGLLRMSYGYKEMLRDSKGNTVPHVHVVEGPLAGMEEHIVKVNQHDRKAYLDLKINGKAVRAGLEIIPKRQFFDENTDIPAVLIDGIEIDLGMLANRMMGAGEDNKDGGETVG